MVDVRKWVRTPGIISERFRYFPFDEWLDNTLKLATAISLLPAVTSLLSPCLFRSRRNRSDYLSISTSGLYSWFEILLTLTCLILFVVYLSLYLKSWDIRLPKIRLGSFPSISIPLNCITAILTHVRMTRATDSVLMSTVKKRIDTDNSWSGNCKFAIYATERSIDCLRAVSLRIGQKIGDNRKNTCHNCSYVKSR